MNRKHNPWVSLVALLLLVTLLVTVCVGCGAKEADKLQAAEAEETERFAVEVVDSGPGVFTYILTDKETAVQYLYAGSGYGGGLTVLQPAPAEEVLSHE